MALAFLSMFPLENLDPTTALVLFAVFGGLAFLFFSYQGRKLDAFMLEMADALGWKPGRYRRRRFSVLPDEMLIREWQGRRVGLSVIGPVKNQAPIIRMTLSWGLPETFKIARRTGPLGKPQEGFEVQGTSPFAERILGTAKVRQALEETLQFPIDHLALSKGRLRVDLCLGRIDPLSDRSRVRFSSRQAWNLLLAASSALPESQPIEAP